MLLSRLGVVSRIGLPSSSTAVRRLAAATTTSGGIIKKKDDDMLETIDIEDLPRAQKRFAKQFEKVNEERIKELFAKNYKNHISFGALLVLVVSIYFYTIYAVKQETFLEEIDAEMAAERSASNPSNPQT